MQKCDQATECVNNHGLHQSVLGLQIKKDVEHMFLMGVNVSFIIPGMSMQFLHQLPGVLDVIHVICVAVKDQYRR